MDVSIPINWVLGIQGVQNSHFFSKERQAKIWRVSLKILQQEHSEAAYELALDCILHQQWEHSAEPGDKTHCPLLDYPSYKYSLKSSKGGSYNSQSRNHIFHSLGSRHPPGTRLSSLLPPSLQAEEKLSRVLCHSIMERKRGEWLLY